MYNNAYWTAPATSSNLTLTFNYVWGLGYLTPSNFDYVSAKFKFRIRAPTTDTYTFYMISDDESSVFIDGVLKLYGGYGATPSATMNLVQNQYYAIDIEFQEYINTADIEISWSTQSMNRQIIPSDYSSCKLQCLASS